MYLAEEVETPVDERRHGEVAHLAKALSARDLLEQVAKRCPEGIAVPSKQWLRLQFWSKNPSLKSSLQYTGKLEVKFMVQACQLRKHHEDAHYCSALFRYLREMCIKFRDHCQLVCMDDKHKWKVGEPGLPVEAIERGKQVCVSTNGKKFAVADHDFTKSTVIQSVTLLCDTPDSIDGSFYRGQVHVYVGIKDAILEASSPLRHSTELGKILKEQEGNPEILLLYTDGGPDHNVTFLSVQLGLIAVFLHHDLDMLEAVRTAPYHSWKNLCKRVNCILNIGLQAVELMRGRMDDASEKKVSNCNTMDEMRKVVRENPGLKEEWEDSIEPVKVLMSSVFQRLSLKDKAFSIFPAAADHEMEASFPVFVTLMQA
jgi:hypothetical protein